MIFATYNKVKKLLGTSFLSIIIMLMIIMI